MPIRKSRQQEHLIMASVASNDVPMEQFLDLIQTNVEKFNNSQIEKQKEYEKQHGQQALWDILYKNKHHPLRARRSTDFSLTPEELVKLRQNKVFFKNIKSHSTFADSYMGLYNNDLPVFVTSDSILYAFHKFYDNYLKEIEENQMIEKFKNICDKMLQLLYSVKTPSILNNTMQNLEILFLVPLVLLSLENELDKDNCSLFNQITLLSPKDKELLLNYNCSNHESYKAELEEVRKENPNFRIPYSKLDKKKIATFKRLNGLPNDFDLDDILTSSPKFRYIFDKFLGPNLEINLKPQFTTIGKIEEAIRAIISLQDLTLNINGVRINMEGSSFKPRGHYTESLEMKQYFRAFTWLSKFEICFKKDMKECSNELVLACLLTIVAECVSTEVKEFENFISKIIGEPDGYTLCSFKKILDEIMNGLDAIPIEERINWVLQNQNSLASKLEEKLVKKCQLTKFGDTDCEKTTYSFKIIGKGNQIDNLIIQRMVDEKLQEDTGTLDKQPWRKFPSILDLVYTLFDNHGVEERLKQMMDKKNTDFQVGRDGYHYFEHLQSIRSELHDMKFVDTIYAQELKMLKALNADKEMLEKKSFSPFYTLPWSKKQAGTQIAHYSELRHDNVLYLEEAFGCSICCEHPDILIEPVPTFWNEFLNLIKMMKELVKDKNNKILDNFELIIGKFIKYLDDLLNHNKIDPVLEEELKCIIIEESGGSGPSIFKGWYINLFADKDDALLCNPEISTMFTAVDDDRGPGGIVHIGTGPTQIMYCIVKDLLTKKEKIMCGPVYSCYEFITPSGKRLNDQEWSKEYQKYQRLDL